MKKIDFFLLIAVSFLFAGINMLNAQSTSNNLFMTGKFLGFADNAGQSGDLFFKVNNHTFMTMQNHTGRVGICKTSPLYPLDVAGAVQIEGAAGTNPAILYLKPSTNGLTAQIKAANNSLFGTLDFIYGPHTIMKFFSNGNVGIGTTAVPTAKLEVAGDIRVIALSGTGNRMLAASSNGLMTSLNAGTASQVLYGNLTWGNLPVAPAALWNSTASDIYFNTGNVGIGVNNPGEKLSVAGNISTSGSLTAASVHTQRLTADSLTSTSGYLSIPNDLTIGGNITFGGSKTISYLPATDTLPEVLGFGRSPDRLHGGCDGLHPPFGATTTNQFSYLIQSWGVNSMYSMSMGFNGNNAIIETAGSDLSINNTCGKNITMCTGGGTVGIGDTHVPPGYKLGVNGKIMAVEMHVKLRANWPDYVFTGNYKALSLKELEIYFKKYKHLPEIPSESEVAKNGLDLGEMDAALLKKIEELTLFIVEQQKQIEQNNSDIQNLKAVIEKR